jgi:crotonobetainyl-CoA:carnitine CoA-transferase CaiB-like acyl-CoA transferase
LPGPLATQFLADLGAEVIKVEDSSGDYSRYFPPHASDGNSAIFHALNRGKKSVKLNMKKAEGKTKLLQLLTTADVLVETFRPGVMAKLGLSPSELAKQFPRLIICSISGYGQTGPAGLMIEFPS